MSARPYYILCVDDDFINHEVIDDYLEKGCSDYELHYVSNGQECLDAA